MTSNVIQFPTGKPQTEPPKKQPNHLHDALENIYKGLYAEFCANKNIQPVCDFDDFVKVVKFCEISICEEAYEAGYREGLEEGYFR